MVDSNLVMKLEQEGLTYQNAYKVAAMMENEDITLREAKKRVAKEIVDQEAKAKAQEEKPYVSIPGDNPSGTETVSKTPYESNPSKSKSKTKAK